MLNSADFIRRYTSDALAAEKAFEERLRAFASEGDDEEVQFALAEQASETRGQIDRLQDHVGGAGEVPGSKPVIAAFLDVAPTIAHTPEERLVQNLMTAYCIIAGEGAMYEALAAVAQYAGDIATETLAREIQAEKRQAGQKLFRFLPSRSKIAYNILSAHEIDPSVETKVGIR